MHELIDRVTGSSHGCISAQGYELIKRAVFTAQQTLDSL